MEPEGSTISARDKTYETFVARPEWFRIGHGRVLEARPRGRYPESSRHDPRCGRAGSYARSRASCDAAGSGPCSATGSPGSAADDDAG
jgi:hypothetical protein